MSIPNVDIVVAGAGIVGCACAWKAAEAGFRVLVVEPRDVASGTTGAAMGHILVVDDNPSIFRLTSWACRLWSELASRLPPSVAYTRTGTLWIASNEEQYVTAKKKHIQGQRLGWNTELVSSQGLYELEPLLRPGLAGGLLVPEDAVVYPPAAASFFLAMARRYQARVVLGRRLVKITPHAVTLDDNEQIGMQWCLLTSGCEVRQLLPELPIFPRKGHLAITDRGAPLVRHQVVELGYHESVRSDAPVAVACNIQPRPTGQLLIGSSRQHGTQSTDVEWSVVRQMLARAIHFLPCLAGQAITRIWTGLRPATPDGLPVLGPCRQTPGVFVIAGHEGLGVTLSVASAELAVNWLLGKPSPIVIEPFLPERFQQQVSALS